jgi:hypothetical protein
MTTDDTITYSNGKLPAVRDGHTGELDAIPPEADDQWLASLRDDDQPLADLRLEPYPVQVVAALHGDPAVFTLDLLTQDGIKAVGLVFEHFARGILNGHDPKAITRRAAVLLMAGGEDGGTPMRCPKCERVHQPLTGPVDWDVAGREDIMCPPCWKAQPKHTVKAAAPVKAAAKKPAAAGTRRRRTSTARGKAVRGAPPDAAA